MDYFLQIALQDFCNTIAPGIDVEAHEELKSLTNEVLNTLWYQQTPFPGETEKDCDTRICKSLDYISIDDIAKYLSQYYPLKDKVEESSTECIWRIYNEVHDLTSLIKSIAEGSDSNSRLQIGDADGADVKSANSETVEQSSLNKFNLSQSKEENAMENNENVTRAFDAAVQNEGVKANAGKPEIDANGMEAQAARDALKDTATARMEASKNIKATAAIIVKKSMADRIPASVQTGNISATNDADKAIKAIDKLIAKFNEIFGVNSSVPASEDVIDSFGLPASEAMAAKKASQTLQALLNNPTMDLPIAPLSTNVLIKGLVLSRNGREDRMPTSAVKELIMNETIGVIQTADGSADISIGYANARNTTGSNNGQGAAGEVSSKKKTVANFTALRFSAGGKKALLEGGTPVEIMVTDPTTTKREKARVAGCSFKYERKNVAAGPANAATAETSDAKAKVTKSTFSIPIFIDAPAMKVNTEFEGKLDDYKVSLASGGGRTVQRADLSTQEGMDAQFSKFAMVLAKISQVADENAPEIVKSIKAEVDKKEAEDVAAARQAAADESEDF